MPLSRIGQVLDAAKDGMGLNAACRTCHICGGPHVEHTSGLGRFELGKQETVGSGKRRIYGYLK